KTVKGVIVSLGKGIIFMIMTASTSQRKSQDYRARRGQRVLDDQLHPLQFLSPNPLCLSDTHRGEGQAVTFRRRGLPGENVAGQLLVKKPVVRDVVIERVNHIVSVEVGLGNGVVRVIAGCISVTYEIEPMTSPTLAVTGRGQKL